MDQQILHVEPFTHTDIRQAWRETQSDQIKTSSSIVAEGYGITEPEVIASGCGENVKRLCGDWRELLIGLRALGPLRLQVRNELISHEISGLLDPMSALDKRLYFISEENSLSLETNRLQLGFLVREQGSDQYNAIYFFDLNGSPVLIIRAPDEMDGLPIALFTRFIHPNQMQDQPVIQISNWKSEAKWPQGEVEQLRQDWASLFTAEKIPQFLETNGLSYLQLLNMLGAPLARPLPKGSLRVLLEVGMDHLIPFHIATHGAGAVMNWKGEVGDIAVHEGLLQVKAIDMHMSCDEANVDHGWLVSMPGADSPSRSEFFDAQGDHLATVTVPHAVKSRYDQGWRDIVETLVTLDF